VGWQHAGLPSDEMSGRVMPGFQRALTTTVNATGHIGGTELAIVTDGLDHLLQKAAKAVHAPFFESMFPAVRRSTASDADAEPSRALGVNDRADDARTLVLGARRPA
jgi:hypothetical protein